MKVSTIAGLSTQKGIFRYVTNVYTYLSLHDYGIYFTESDPQNSRDEDQYRYLQLPNRRCHKACISGGCEVRLCGDQIPNPKTS